MGGGTLRRGRRSLIPALLAAAALGVSALSGCGGNGANGPAQAADKPDPLPKFTKIGQPLTGPPVIRSHHGLLKTTLVAANRSIRVGGVKIDNAMTYSAPGARGELLGPTLKVRPGDTLDITLDNRLRDPADVRRPSDGGGKRKCPTHGGPRDASCQRICPKMEPGMHGMHHAGGAMQSPSRVQWTNLHFHGLHVTPKTRYFHGRPVLGDNVLANLGRGRHHIRFHIPKHHDRGTFWYHAHRHGCTDDQVFRGLAGILLIGDVRTRLPRRFRHVKTRTLALRDIEAISTGPHSGAIPNDHDWDRQHLKQTTVNGLVKPTIAIRPGETQLWRVMNTSADLWYKIALLAPGQVRTGDLFTIVARDGNPSSRPQSVRSWVVAPGNRIDILVRGNAAGEPRELVTLPFDQGRRPNPPAEDPRPTFPGAMIARVVPRDAAERPLAGDRVSGYPLPHFPRRRGPTRRFNFTFNRAKHPKRKCGVRPPKSDFAFINGCPFSEDRKFAVKPRVGTTEKWILTNDTAQWHPFHIHQNDFRVISVNGKHIKHPPGDQDTIGIPPAYKTTGKKGRVVKGRVVILMPFQRFSGDFVFHCHILDHEDGGMMKLVHLLPRRRKHHH